MHPVEIIFGGKSLENGAPEKNLSHLSLRASVHFWCIFRFLLKWVLFHQIMMTHRCISVYRMCYSLSWSLYHITTFCTIKCSALLMTGVFIDLVSLYIFTAYWYWLLITSLAACMEYKYSNVWLNSNYIPSQSSLTQLDCAENETLKTHI